MKLTTTDRRIIEVLRAKKRVSTAGLSLLLCLDNTTINRSIKRMPWVITTRQEKTKTIMRDLWELDPNVPIPGEVRVTAPQSTIRTVWQEVKPWPAVT